MDPKDFNSFLSQQNDLFSKRQFKEESEKEPSHEIDVAGALAIVAFYHYSNGKTDPFANITTPLDVYCFCAALNYLNRYLKLKLPIFLEYSAVKPQVSFLMASQKTIHAPTIIIETGYDKKETIASIKVGPVQFSFHSVEEGDTFNFFKTLNGIVIFDGISKQCCATTVLRSAMDACRRFGYPIINHTPLQSFVESTLDLFRGGYLLIGTNGLIVRSTGAMFKFNSFFNPGGTPKES